MRFCRGSGGAAGAVYGILWPLAGEKDVDEGCKRLGASFVLAVVEEVSLAGCVCLMPRLDIENRRCSRYLVRRWVRRLLRPWVGKLWELMRVGGVGWKIFVWATQWWCSRSRSLRRYVAGPWCYERIVGVNRV